MYTVFLNYSWNTANLMLNNNQLIH